MPRRKAVVDQAAETTSTATTAQMSEVETEGKQPQTSRKKGTPLSPEQIKVKMAEMEGRPIDEVAKACGFYTEITDNATGAVDVRVTQTDQLEFLKASLEAQSGVKLAAAARPYRRTNRSPVVKIGKTGNIVVGGRHTAIAEFPFGENVDSYVKIEAEKGRIVITAGEKEVADQGDIDDIDAEEENDDLDL